MKTKKNIKYKQLMIRYPIIYLVNCDHHNINDKKKKILKY